MSDTANDFVELLKRKAPAYLDLLTAKTEEEFEAAFDQALDVAVRFLEQNSKEFNELGENGLSSVLAGKLSCPGLSVTRETNSNGHVDLTIEAEHSTPPRTKLGEAKIYDGPKNHFGGLNQLLSRYTTGRETRGLVITYVRQKNIVAKMKGIRDEMDEVNPENQTGRTSDHTLRWSFVSTHNHSSGEDVEVAHVGINMYVE